MIRAAEYPLLLIGAGANRKKVRSALCSFVKKTGTYFFNTQMGKGCVDENLPEFIGTAALSENDYIHCAIDRSDLIINVGHDVVEKPPFFMEHGGKKVIHINFSTAIVDNVYFPQLEVVGDIASSIERLTSELGNLGRDYSYFARVKKELYMRMNVRAQYNDFPIKPQRFVADVRKAIPSDGIIA